MNRIILVALAALALAVPAATAAPDARAASPTIAGLAAKTPQFSTLLSLVKKAGLAETLSPASPARTVFAPTNAAFAKVPKATLDKLAKNPAALKRVSCSTTSSRARSRRRRSSPCARRRRSPACP